MKDDEKFYLCEIDPNDPNDSPRYDFVYLAIEGEYKIMAGFLGQRTQRNKEKKHTYSVLPASLSNLKNILALHSVDSRSAHTRGLVPMTSPDLKTLQDSKVRNILTHRKVTFVLFHILQSHPLSLI